MKTLFISSGYFFSWLNNFRSLGITWSNGAKPNLMQEPKSIKKSDNSGFVRYLLYRLAVGNIMIPTRSAGQKAWCEEQG